MDLEKLKIAGLSEKEAKTYTALLELGDCLVSEAAEKTGINRSLLYAILEGLARKGMVTYILKNNVRYYRAAEPEKILALLKEKEKAFESVLPELAALKKPRTKKPVVEILEGIGGIKTIFNDVLRQKQDWFAFDVPGKGPETVGQAVHDFEKERQKAGIALNVICVRTEAGKKRGKQFSRMKNTNVRYNPVEYESPVSNWVYGDRVVTIFWSKDLPFAVRIIDKDFAETYKNHFRTLWNYSKEQ